jgi:transposase
VYLNSARKTVIVLRAELGDVSRFQRIDQAVAYAGLDIQVKQSGKWKGQAKLSKRGSGRLRRILYLAAARCTRLEGSAFGAYYHRLVARGMRKREALIAVMRKMLIVAVHLLKTKEEYDPSKVAVACGGSAERLGRNPPIGMGACCPHVSSSRV